MPRNLIPEGFRDDVSEQVLTEHKFTNEFIEHSDVMDMNWLKLH